MQHQGGWLGPVVIGLSCFLLILPGASGDVGYQASNPGHNPPQYTDSLADTIGPTFLSSFNTALAGGIVAGAIEATFSVGIATVCGLDCPSLVVPLVRPSAHKIEAELAVLEFPVEAGALSAENSSAVQADSQVSNAAQGVAAGRSRNLESKTAASLPIDHPKFHPSMLLILIAAAVGAEIWRRRRSSGYRIV